MGSAILPIKIVSVSIKKSKFIQNYEGTTARVHDSNILASLCDANERAFDDSAYVGKSVPEGCQHRTSHRAFRTPIN
ncbi:Mobile element protein [Streptococcus sp. DD10]|nr:Mobile element protein [Streptococcus sp. DD10]